VRAADLIAKRLLQAGVRHAFGIPGGEILALIEALRAAGIPFVTARHETAAGLMAEGFAAHTGGPALLLVTVGPGLSNAVNAVANALLDRVPLLVLSASLAEAGHARFTHQVFDQQALLAPVTKASLRAERGAVDATLQRGLTLALAEPRGPVHVELPIGLLAAHELPAEPVAASVPPVDAATLGRMAALLARAQRPLVLAGLESTHGAVPEALRQLLHTLDAPLLTTYKAKGVLDEYSPRAIGAIGLSPRADAIARQLLRAADALLLVGYDPVEMRAAYVEPFAPATRLLELAASPRTHTMHRAELALCGDLALGLDGLRAQLPRASRTRWLDSVPATTRNALSAQLTPGMGFSPQAVVDTLSRVTPPCVRLTVDTGAHRIVFSQAFRARSPGQALQSNGLCTMGYALPAAIGLALASREPVLALMGDGGFDMVAGELATLRDLELPVTLVIFDDQCLALIDLKQAEQQLPRCGVWSGATDHVAVARAYGGHGARVQDAASLERALVEALARRRGFSLISCALARGAYAGLI
jgi:acetolactate synthase-1/2/3 large subunit